MRVVLVGYGKMGREIEKILIARGHEVVLVIDIENADELNAANLKDKKADVAIEFTTPETAFANITKCIEAGVGVVSGSTGWLDNFDRVKALCREKDGAFFYASNYSLGVNIFFRLNKMLAGMMEGFPEYDVTVEEVHHTQKKDAPSGTAITIAQGILGGISRKNKWVGNTTTQPDELEVVSVRRSVVPGTHTVTYESPNDKIAIAHEAKSRTDLAAGAVKAAEFIYGRKGVFSMDDLMDI